MKNKVAIISVYFGRLPNWFQLWLNSCKYNKDFNWIIFTDDTTIYDYPSNVRKISCKFDDIKNRISEKLDLNINIKDAYKLCDFKVAYGEIFKDYLINYTHWGYCDLDMIFGDLSNFITDDLLDGYERIFTKGHLTIYKNSKKVNQYYKLPYSGVEYKNIYNSKYHYGFDEVSGMDKIFKEHNLSQYNPKKTIIADIDFSNYRFKVRFSKNYKNQYFSWENGKVYRTFIANNKEKKEEFLYIHFQKRKIENFVNKKSIYTISPKGIFEFYNKQDSYLKNRENFYRYILNKLRYEKIKLNQRIYRALHWKFNL